MLTVPTAETTAEPAGVRTFGELLRELRETAGLTQEQLAERAGLTPHGISALERGLRSRPYPHTVQSLAAALNLSPDLRQQLIDSVPKRRRSTAPGQEGTTPGDAPLAASGDASDERAVPRPSGLPAVDALVGREHDLANVVSLVSAPAHRLVTLVGTGGVGKTTLALAAAKRVLEQPAELWPQGTPFVPLATLDDARLVIPAVARALGMTMPEATDDDQALLATMSGVTALVVLDNLEHLTDVADVVARLLGTCPGITVLATSRSSLRLRGETEYAVHPLALPPAGSLDLDEVASAPAAELLLRRAHAVAPSFGTRPEDAATIVDLCDVLGGIPLALELAAARARVLSPQDMLARIGDILDRSGPVDLPARQRTMRAAIEWSYRLLTPDEQRLLRLLAAFPNAPTLDAIEATAPLEDALGTLEALVSHSLVLVVDTPDGLRYRMLEPVRHFAQSLTDPAERTEIREAHAAYYLGWSQQALGHFYSEQQVRWFDDAERDDDNLSAAVQWYVETGRGEAAARMCWSLWLYWWLRGHLRRGRRLAEQTLATDVDGGWRARVQLPAAAMAFAQAELAAAAAHWGESLRVAQEAGDLVAEQYGYAGNGLATMATGDLVAADGWFEQAQDLGVEPVEAHLITSLVLVWRGTVRRLLGDPELAQDLVSRGLRLATERGDRLSTYIALYELVQVAIGQGELDAARDHLCQGIELSDETGDYANLAYFLESLAVVTQLQGDAERAMVLLGASTALRESVGSSFYGYYLPDPALRTTADASARAALGADRAAELFAQGHALGPDDAVDYAQL